MNKFFLMALAAISIFAVGCNDTAAGMEEDAKENMERAENQTDDLKGKTEEVGKDIQEGAKNLAAAGTLTPMIKSAIVGSPILNDDGNKINVDSDDNEVRLEGTVQTEAMKAEAEKLAKEVMKDNKAHQTLKNNLKVAK